MGDVVTLPLQLDTDLGRALIADCARFSEKILTEAQIRKRYKLSEAAWADLADNEALLESIELEKLRRIKDGSAKREKAQMFVVKAPEVANNIMLDEAANARHRLDAGKLLNDFADNGGREGTPGMESRFIISINLGGDVEVFNKSYRANPNDTDPYSIEHDITPPRVIVDEPPAAVADKPKRGRPRKTVVEEPKPKRPRGRPRKIVLKVGDDGNAEPV